MFIANPLCRLAIPTTSPAGVHFFDRWSSTGSGNGFILDQQPTFRVRPTFWRIGTCVPSAQRRDQAGAVRPPATRAMYVTRRTDGKKRCRPDRWNDGSHPCEFAGSVTPVDRKELLAK